EQRLLDRPLDKKTEEELKDARIVVEEFSAFLNDSVDAVDPGVGPSSATGHEGGEGQKQEHRGGEQENEGDDNRGTRRMTHDNRRAGRMKLRKGMYRG
ncbi:hypothetical protein BC938DRAFT_483901, partial [Jimgerdemannia flammicorona]